MKKNSSIIITLGSILLLGGIVLMPYTANAVVSGLIDVIAPSVFNTGVGWLGNIVLQFTSWAVTIGGLFLSISMNITLHIKELYESIPAIESTWVLIRDLSSIFIIFMLLYSAIIMILGVGKGPSFGSLVLKIFIAGMLINFSLFFVRVAVDASNLVSLQFYNAIAPETSKNFTTASAYYDGGLSNIFMQSLKIPKIYDNKSWLKGTDITGAIVLATFGGAILMITAAFSFFAAAIAFTIRTGLLVFIMALSPLFFVAMIFPKVGEKSDEMFKILKGQLIFMPVYLGLMYVALRVISDQGFMSIFNASPGVPALQTGDVFGFTMAGVVIQYTIAALFINAPLAAAIGAGAWGAKWAPDASAIGKRIGGLVGRNTAGRIGKWAGESFDRGAASGKVFGSETLYKMGAPLTKWTGINQAIRGGLASAEKGKYGGRQTLADVESENKKRAREVAGVARSGRQAAVLATVMNRGVTPTLAQTKTFNEEVRRMSKKEIEETKFEKLSNPLFVSKLSSKQFDALIEGDAITDDQKGKLKGIRKQGLQETMAHDNNNLMKDTIKNLSGKELADLDINTLRRAEVLNNLTPEHLKAMEDILDRPTKQMISGHIRGLPPTNDHKAFGWMNNARNFRNWS